MERLTVFFDGACVVCYREIIHYKNKDIHNLIEMVDISASDFVASDYGLDAKEVNIHIHSKDESGNIFTGVETFSEVWKRVPPYDKLTPVLSHKLFQTLLKPGYNVFAHHIRPRLPKRKVDDCEDGVCDTQKV